MKKKQKPFTLNPRCPRCSDEGWCYYRHKGEKKTRTGKCFYCGDWHKVKRWVFHVERDFSAIRQFAVVRETPMKLWILSNGGTMDYRKGDPWFLMHDTLEEAQKWRADQIQAELDKWQAIQSSHVKVVFVNTYKKKHISKTSP